MNLSRVLLLISAGMAIMLGVFVAWEYRAAATRTPATPPAPAPAQAAVLDVEQVVARTMPSIVQIEVDRLDGRKSLGTGVIVGSEGIVVTAAHVIENALDIHVGLANGRSERPVGGGTDFSRDLALLALPPPHATGLALRDDGAGRVGEPVVVIGHPLGLERTVSDGLLSGIRKVSEDLLLLQTTAPVNSGNSGGPLLDRQARVLGIVSFKMTGKSVEGVNFAVPAQHVKQLLDAGAVRPYDELLAQARAHQSGAPLHDTEDAPSVGRTVNIAGTWQDTANPKAVLYLKDDLGGTLRARLVEYERNYDGTPYQSRIVRATEISLNAVAGGAWEGALDREWACSGSQIARGADGVFRSSNVENRCTLKGSLSLRLDPVRLLLVGDWTRPEIPPRTSAAYARACESCGKSLPDGTEQMTWQRVR